MFRNKHWQCLFRAFWSLSVHVSSTLSDWWRLQFYLVTQKCRLGNCIFLKKEIRQSAAWDTCSSCLLQPRRPDGSWGQPGAEPGAGCGTASPGSWPADKCCSTRALSSLPVFSRPLPPSFHKSPAPLLHIWLSPTSVSGRYFFHTSPNPMCKKSLTSLLPPTEQILISKFSKLFCLIILYFLSCLSWLPSYKSWFASFKIYCDVQIVSICICEVSCEVSGENLL